MVVNRRYLIFVLLGLLLTACQGRVLDPATATLPDPQAIFTAAARTADARMTQQAEKTPTQTVAGVTQTPTAGLSQPTLTLTIPVPTASFTPPPPGADKAAFVTDVTVPDGTVFEAGEIFTKTWRLQNAGITTWTREYALVFSSGVQMGAETIVPLDKDVAPGEVVDVSVALVAPAAPGNYIGFWMLQNANQQKFGLGDSGNQPFYLQIIVNGSAGLLETPATPNGDIVSSISLKVDEADVEGACPHSFNFTAQFSLSQAATVEYQLEAETGFDLTLPEPTIGELGPGTHTIVYTLEFTDAVSGWARFRISEPDNLRSRQVNFQLTCNP